MDSMDTVDRAVGDPGGQVIIDDEVVKLRYIIFILNRKKALSRLKMSNPIKSDAVKKKKKWLGEISQAKMFQQNLWIYKSYYMNFKHKNMRHMPL